VGIKIVWGRSIGWNMDVREMEQTIITDGADCYPWHETFVIWPRRSVSGAPLFWTKAYKRKVWVVWGTGFHMEPETQYATAFDLLTYDNNKT
jgi:hypothetical protein